VLSQGSVEEEEEEEGQALMMRMMMMLAGSSYSVGKFGFRELGPPRRGLGRDNKEVKMMPLSVLGRSMGCVGTA